MRDTRLLTVKMTIMHTYVIMISCSCACASRLTSCLFRRLYGFKSKTPFFHPAYDAEPYRGCYGKQYIPLKREHCLDSLRASADARNPAKPPQLAWPPRRHASCQVAKTTSPCIFACFFKTTSFRKLHSRPPAPLPDSSRAFLSPPRRNCSESSSP